MKYFDNFFYEREPDNRLEIWNWSELYMILKKVSQLDNTNFNYS